MAEIIRDAWATMLRASMLASFLIKSLVILWNFTCSELASFSKRFSGLHLLVAFEFRAKIFKNVYFVGLFYMLMLWTFGSFHWRIFCSCCSDKFSPFDAKSSVALSFRIFLLFCLFILTHGNGSQLSARQNRDDAPSEEFWKGPESYVKSQIQICIEF